MKANKEVIIVNNTVLLNDQRHDFDEINLVYESDLPKFKFNKPKDEIDKAIQAFLTGHTDAYFGRYHIHGDMLLYKTAVTEGMSIVGQNCGTDDKSKNKQNLENVASLVERTERNQIDLSSHSLKELKEFYSKLKKAKGDISKLKWNENISEVKFRVVKANVIAKRINDTTYIGNSAALGLIGRTVAFGNEDLNRDESDVQRRLAQYIPMIPFNVFHEASLDLNKYCLIDRGNAETIVRDIEHYDKKLKKNIKVPEDVHFTGASLFSVDKKCYLFDVDRREVEHRVFNPFLAEIPTLVNSIAEAYEALKPSQVNKAEKQGLNVLRQGEWFFIPSDVKEPTKKLNADTSRWQKAGSDVLVGEYSEDPQFNRHNSGSYTLKAGNNRPNYVAQGFTRNGIAYVRGVVIHSGREHAPLVLKTWHRAIPNTATHSFTIVGDID